MHSPEATIHCPNPICQAPNPESHRFCQQCRTSLPKRYLWAVGKAVESVRSGELLANRYGCQQSRIFIDTKPGLLPESPEELPEIVEPYLRLFPYQLHVPQIYAVVPSPKKRSADILLLDRAPIYPYEVIDSGVNVQESTLMPELGTIWPQSTALRQLNWLWQIAQLWEPLRREGVASSLLTPTLLRVEGSLVRLLELQGDSERTPVLADLGKTWQCWQLTAQPEIADYLAALCEQMQQGEVDAGEQLVLMLDRAIAVCGQTQTRQLQIATLTDQGPMRQRNEDACYPPSGTTLVAKTDVGDSPNPVNGALPLVVVCDGIGGHEGGNIASNLAIATIQQRLQQQLRQATQLESAMLTAELEQIALAANDVITERNDTEQRHERQRMGTTLVMASGHAHELYLTHVGDSRAYRVTRTGCHQVTVDDDLASREVRLGYTLYRNALQQPNSGSLVQALGMNVSSLLHPTVQRFVLDEDCLFLLCSDGLSDNDRVEEHWQTVLLPVLQGEMDLDAASRQLVVIANQQNGHDNVTIGLVCCRVLPNPHAPSSVQLSASLATLPPPSHLVTHAASSPEISTALSGPKTRDLTPPPRSRSNLPLIFLGFLLCLGVGGLLAYLFIPNIVPQLLALINKNSGVVSTTSTTEDSPSPPIVLSPSPSLTPKTPGLTVRSRVQINRSASDTDTQTPVVLQSRPGTSIPAGASPPTAQSVPIGSVLEVISQQVLAGQTWLQLRVCSLPDAASPTPLREKVRSVPRPAKPGDAGWVLKDAIVPLINPNLSLTEAQLGQCAINLR